MGNEILRDMVFGCAGALMVLAAIGLPPREQVGRQQWPAQFQDVHLLPYYSPHNPAHRGLFLGPGGPGSRTP